MVYIDYTYVPNYYPVQRYRCVHITLAYMTLLLSIIVHVFKALTNEFLVDTYLQNQYLPAVVVSHSM